MCLTTRTVQTREFLYFYHTSYIVTSELLNHVVLSYSLRFRFNIPYSVFPPLVVKPMALPCSQSDTLCSLFYLNSSNPGQVVFKWIWYQVTIQGGLHHYICFKTQQPNKGMVMKCSWVHCFVRTGMTFCNKQNPVILSLAETPGGEHATSLEKVAQADICQKAGK